jgi:Crp-like helix-turn-helix domain
MCDNVQTGANKVDNGASTCAKSGLNIMPASATPKANRLLAALPEAVYRRLLPDLEVTNLRVGEALCSPAGRLQFAYFPTSSVVASYFDGAVAEAPLIGREGMAGISLILGGPTHDNRLDVEVGGTAFRLPATSLIAEFLQAGALQKLLLRYVFARLAQGSQLGVCSRSHPIEQRLCRLLSRIFARVSGDEVALTQVRIAALLGVRRVSITNAAGHLRTAGIVDYQRGEIRLVSRKKLQERTCPCAEIIRRAFESVTQA